MILKVLGLIYFYLFFNIILMSSSDHSRKKTVLSKELNINYIYIRLPRQRSPTLGSAKRRAWAMCYNASQQHMHFSQVSLEPCPNFDFNDHSLIKDIFFSDFYTFTVNFFDSTFTSFFCCRLILLVFIGSWSLLFIFIVSKLLFGLIISIS